MDGYRLLVDKDVPCLCKKGTVHCWLSEHLSGKQISIVKLNCKECEEKYHIELYQEDYPFYGALYAYVENGKSIHGKDRKENLQDAIMVPLPKEWYE